MIYRLSIIFLFSLLSVSVSSQEQHVENRPRFDPFKKPHQLMKPSTKSQETKSLFHDKLQLFATLRAGKNSMVNIQGRIVQLGEEIEGYKLMQVNDRSAIFAKNEQKVHLSLDTE